MINPPVLSSSLILAVDIGGTKVAAGLVSASGQILDCIQEPTCQSGPSDGIAQIIHLVTTVLNRNQKNPADTAGIGIGIPAVLEEGTDFILWGPNLKGWRNVALRSELEKHFNLPVCIEYDGHTAVLGEWWMGAGKGYRSLVDIIIGTGVGGGMILDGHLFRGKNRLAGAAGWFVMNHESIEEDVSQHKLGSWEAQIAGPGLALRAHSLLEGDQYSNSALRHCLNITAKEIYTEAQSGDILALHIVEEQANLLGCGIANIISLINPEIVILGGSVGCNAGFLIPKITETVNRWAQPISAKSTSIVSSSLGAKASLLGAAYGAFLRFDIRL